MNKQAIDPVTTARHGLGGALLGGSAAAILSLVHAARLARERNKEQEPSETDENTIVITLPSKKTANVVCDGDMPVAIKKEEKPKAESKVVAAKSYRAGFYPNQKMKSGSFDKQADWPTLTASVLAATGGSMLGYNIIDKAYRQSLQRKLKAEEEAARKELFDVMVQRHNKVASDWLSNFDLDLTLDKESSIKEKSTFSYLDAPFAAAALLALLGSGGTAFITKKVLDETLKEQQQDYKPPKVQKIVFKSASTMEPGEEQLSSDELDAVKTALFLTMDDMGYDRVINKDQDVLKLASSSELDLEELYKLANQQPNILVTMLSKNPELRRSLQTAYMKEHPFLRYFTGALKLPGVGNLADKLTYKKLNSITGSKSAGILMPSFVGSVLAEKALTKAVSKPEKPVLPPDEEVKAEQMQEFLNNLQLSANDPEAAAYLADNQDRIRMLLARMAVSKSI